MSKLGIDVGGTFTDAVMVSGRGELRVAKTPTTPNEVERGTISAATSLAERLDEIERLVHGTTLVTNALVERRTSPVGFITTAGFRDALEIRRTLRKHLYDIEWEKPSPLVPRRLRLEVSERIDKNGSVLRKLDEHQVRRAAEEFARQGIRDVAICFLFSFVNDIHEREAAKIVNEVLPEARISLSCDVLPELREYERASTTVLNAMSRAAIERYLSTLTGALSREGFSSDLQIMKADGGMASISQLMTRSVEAFGSGPAGGVIAAVELGRLLERSNLLTLDMGGTTTDVSLIWNGEPVYTMEEEIEFGVPIRIPMIYVRSIGAGGGSLAWLDPAGALRVGPHSAGADPGPACYGTGGTSATLTDANVVLGRIDPDFFLGGSMKLEVELALKAISALAEEFGWSPGVTANSINRIAVANLVQAIREVSIDRGYDPRDFSLVAYGGAGPLYAAEIADELGIPEVIVPRNAGVFSALGCLSADFKHEQLRTLLIPAVPEEVSRVLTAWNELDTTARELLPTNEETKTLHFLDMRYIGEAFEITVPLHDAAERDLMDVALAAFKDEHDRLYGFTRNDPVEIVNARIRVVTPVPRIRSQPLASVNTRSTESFRRGILPDGSEAEVTVYRRSTLPAGWRQEGPLIIEEEEATTLVLRDQTAEIDPFGNIIVSPGTKPSIGKET